jgi:hypothetical protein
VSGISLGLVGLIPLYVAWNQFLEKINWWTTLVLCLPFGAPLFWSPFSDYMLNSLN